jgi:hypothetical protein
MRVWNGGPWVVVGLASHRIGVSLVDPQTLLFRHRVAELPEVSLSVWESMRFVSALGRELANLSGSTTGEIRGG